MVDAVDRTCVDACSRGVRGCDGGRIHSAFRQIHRVGDMTCPTPRFIHRERPRDVAASTSSDHCAWNVPSVGAGVEQRPGGSLSECVQPGQQNVLRNLEAPNRSRPRPLPCAVLHLKDQTVRSASGGSRVMHDDASMSGDLSLAAAITQTRLRPPCFAW